MLQKNTEKTNLRKSLLIAAGSMALSLGVIGIFIPLLPTTPFLLLASACFIRSSERLYTWLTKNRYLGGYLIAYQKYHAILPENRVVTIAVLWAGIIASALFATRLLWVRILLGIIAVGVTAHLVRLKKLTAEMKREIKNHYRS